MTTTTDTKRASIKERTEDQLAKAIEKLQTKYSWSKTATIDFLCNYALNRIETLARDAEKRASLAPPKEPKIKKEKPAKAPKTPKEPKAKAPKAEKPKKEPAPPKEKPTAKQEQPKREPPTAKVTPLMGDYLPRARKLMESCKNEKDLQSVRENCAKNCTTTDEFAGLDAIYSECLAKIDAKKAQKKEQPAKDEKKKEAPKKAKANKQSTLF